MSELAGWGNKRCRLRHHFKWCRSSTDFQNRNIYNYSRDLLKKEAMIHQTLSHSNILSLLGMVFEESNNGEPGKYGLILEYMDHGELGEFLGRNVLSWDEKLVLISQVACGINYSTVDILRSSMEIWRFKMFSSINLELPKLDFQIFEY